MLHNKQPYYFGRSNPRLQSRSRLVRRPTKLASIDCHRSDPGGKRLAVFVSGTGSNFRKIHESCQNKKIRGAIAVLITNNLHCPAAEFATNCDIPIRLYPSKSDRSLVPLLKETFKVDIVLLAGYLKLLPADIIREFPKAILNIHPSLLPSFGGKGYYGVKVHEAVLASGAKFSGPTVHFVSEDYDKGVILDQRIVPVLPNDTPQSLAQRVLQKEHELYSTCVAALCDDRVGWNDRGVPFIKKAIVHPER